MSNRLYRVVEVQASETYWSVEVAFKRWFGLTQSDWKPTHEWCHSEADAIQRALEWISLWGGEIV